MNNDQLPPGAYTIQPLKEGAMPSTTICLQLANGQWYMATPLVKESEAIGSASIGVTKSAYSYSKEAARYARDLADTNRKLDAAWTDLNDLRATHARVQTELASAREEVASVRNELADTRSRERNLRAAMHNIKVTAGSFDA